MAKQQIPTINQLVTMMADKGDCTRGFEVELTRFVNAQVDESKLMNLCKKGKNINYQYLGFYGMQVYYRHRLQYDASNDMFGMYGEKFLRFNSYKHLRTLNYIESGEFYTMEKLNEHIEEARSVVDEYCALSQTGKKVNLAGARHAFVDLLITSCERYEDRQQELLKKWSKIAEHELKQAIAESNGYAKYYCTQGRLQALRGEYDKAIESIRQAIRKESPKGNANRYSLRIMQYQSHLLRVQARGEIERLNVQQTRMKEDVERIRGSLMNNVEVIAFFSGVISFVIGSLNLMEAFSAAEAAGLIVVLLGTLLVVFNCFALLLHVEKKILPARIVVFVVGILCIAGGLFLVL